MREVTDALKGISHFAFRTILLYISTSGYRCLHNCLPVSVRKMASYACFRVEEDA